MGLEAFGQPRLICRVAIRARHPRATTGAGALALPRSIRIVFTNSAAVFANEAFHGDAL